MHERSPWPSINWLNSQSVWKGVLTFDCRARGTQRAPSPPQPGPATVSFEATQFPEPMQTAGIRISPAECHLFRSV